MATRKKKTSETGIIEWIKNLNHTAQLILAVATIAGLFGISVLFKSKPTQETIGNGKPAMGNHDPNTVGNGKPKMGQ
jgi:hypothetical protein